MNVSFVPKWIAAVVAAALLTSGGSLMAQDTDYRDYYDTELENELESAIERNLDAEDLRLEADAPAYDSQLESRLERAIESELEENADFYNIDYDYENGAWYNDVDYDTWYDGDYGFYNDYYYDDDWYYDYYGW